MTALQDLGPPPNTSHVASTEARLTVPLPAVVDIAGVATLKEVLRHVLEQPGQILVRGEAVERVDGAGLQLLYGFVREAEASARVVEWQGVSPELLECAALCGLTAALGLPREGAPT